MILINTLSGNIALKSKLSLEGDMVTGKKLELEGNIEKCTVAPARWGLITGDIENQTDLIEYLSIINCGTSTEVV